MNFYNKGNRTAFFFRKWARKNYSLYSILKRVVHISVLSVMYLIAVPVVTVAQQDTLEVKMQYDLDEVEVTAARAPVVFSQVARVITIIDAQEIGRMPAANVQDLLEYVPGVDIRQRGPEGVQADISVRGGSFDQVLILLNGINITDPQTGHHNLNLPVSLAQVERIEILEGPAARVYGPNAFSGAINIITRKTDDNHLSAYFSAGSFGYLNGGITGRVQTGRFSHLLAGNMKKSDGYIDNTDFSASDVYYNGELLSNVGRLFVQGGLAGKDFGANSFYTATYPDQYEKVKTLFGSARFETSTRLNITPAIYWRRHYDTFMLFRDEAPDWYTNHNYHRTDVWGADINSWFVWSGGKTALGAGYRSEGILSNVLGEPLGERIEYQEKDVFYTHEKIRSTVSVFAEHTFFLNNWIITGGLMANHISDNRGGTGVFPGIDVSYQLVSPLKIIASLNSSLRMPTFSDLYYSGPTNEGNPDLVPEKATTAEVGVKLNASVIKAHAVLFHRKGTNLIDWIREEGETIWTSMNHTEINSRGAEMNLIWFSRNHLSSHLPHRIDLGYMYINQQKNDSPLLSYYVMDYLKHKLVASVTQRLHQRFSLNVKTILQDREGSYTHFGAGGLQQEMEYKPFLLVDAKAILDLGRMGIELSVNNLLNRSYHDFGNIEQPGRWLKAGVSYDLNYHNKVH